MEKIIYRNIYDYENELDFSNDTEYFSGLQYNQITRQNGTGEFCMENDEYGFAEPYTLDNTDISFNGCTTTHLLRSERFYNKPMNAL